MVGEWMKRCIKFARIEWNRWGLGVITLRPGIAAGEPRKSRRPQLNHVKNACLFLVDSFRVSVRLHGIKPTSNSTLGNLLENAILHSKNIINRPDMMQLSQALLARIKSAKCASADGNAGVGWSDYWRFACGHWLYFRLLIKIYCCILYMLYIFQIFVIYFNTIDNILVQCNLLYSLYAMCFLHYTLWSVVHTTFTKALL